MATLPRKASVWNPGADVTPTDSNLAVELADSSIVTRGDAKVAVNRILAGAVATTLHLWIEKQAVHLESDFGASGDGIIDDTTAVVNALASGKVVVGNPLSTYAVSGNITLPATAYIRDCKFKQLTPNNASRRTLTATNATSIFLNNVTVDINGDGSNGTVTDAAGIWLSGCNKVVLENVEVFGNGYTNGIVVVDCNDVRMISPYVHDMIHGTASSANPGDDRINGIWLIRGNRVIIIAPKVNNLLGRWLGQPQFNRYTRGITVSGTQGWSIVGPTIDNVDQGIDVTGSENAERGNILGGTVDNCYTWGVKFANTPSFCSVVGVSSWRAGIAGFICSPPASALSQQTQYILSFRITFSLVS